MEFLITLALSFTLILIALLVFRYVGLPIYRIEAVNVKVLLESVLNQQATEADWDVFIGMPIRHNLQLDDIRVQCAMLAERDMHVRDGRVHFSSDGRAELAAILKCINSELLPHTEHYHD